MGSCLLLLPPLAGLVAVMTHYEPAVEHPIYKGRCKHCWLYRFEHDEDLVCPDGPPPITLALLERAAQDGFGFLAGEVPSE